ESEAFDQMEAKLLTERNNRWIKAIQEKLGDKSVFFAVGAMHLVGDNGLIKQLQSAGYTVEAVK
ncbi:MAG: TraB/GumN family protein, partial [Flavobacteriales bacterium]|nr:TraB/GumN family protein [Flavobacteriales bacterium]